MRPLLVWIRFNGLISLLVWKKKKIFADGFRHFLFSLTWNCKQRQQRLDSCICRRHQIMSYLAECNTTPKILKQVEEICCLFTFAKLYFRKGVYWSHIAFNLEMDAHLIHLQFKLNLLSALLFLQAVFPLKPVLLHPVELFTCVLPRPNFILAGLLATADSKFFAFVQVFRHPLL